MIQEEDGVDIQRSLDVRNANSENDNAQKAGLDAGYVWLSCLTRNMFAPHFQVHQETAPPVTSYEANPNGQEVPWQSRET